MTSLEKPTQKKENRIVTNHKNKSNDLQGFEELFIQPDSFEKIIEVQNSDNFNDESAVNISDAMISIYLDDIGERDLPYYKSYQNSNESEDTFMSYTRDAASAIN